MKYTDQLKDPRWQKKRLEILQRDKFSCRGCARNDIQLHVHHSYYEKGLSVWEYPDLAFHSLCERCHPIRARAESLLLQAVHGLTARELAELGQKVVDILDKRFLGQWDAEMGSPNGIMEMKP